MRLFKRIYQAYLNPDLDFRVRLFNVLAMGGTVISFTMAVLGAVNSGVFNMALNLLISALSFGLLVFSSRTGRYQLCYMITIVGIFICLFPVLFFEGGGYHSGMPAFFVFAVVFTVFMLEGVKAILFSISELAIYIACCIVAYLRPDAIQFFETEQDLLIDVIVAVVTVCVVLGTCMFFHFRLYNQQQRKLDEQNAILARANLVKTQFLANASHEMRTPLTVISVNVQVALRLLQRMDDVIKDPEAETMLQNAQSEIMRLSRMVDGMLTLASISDGTEKRKTDFSALAQSAADMLLIHLQERGNTLETHIDEALLVFADPDLLSQVIVNLIQNAHKHTENGKVALDASCGDGKITVTVRDDGSGIAPELLPRVFERGVSDGGGKGLGLDFCKTVVESHGGAIWIESNPGKGTVVYFTLPAYEGQL